jgi:hypothetical protein
MAVALVAAIVNVAGAPVAQAATDDATAAPTRVDNGNGVAKATLAPHAGTVTGTSRAPKGAAAPATPSKSSPAHSKLTGRAQPAQAKPQHHTKSTIRYEVHHDHSAPLASMPLAATPSKRGPKQPVRPMPNHGGGPAADPAVQSTIGPAAPTLGTGFDGVGEGFTGPQGTFTVPGIPPDTNAAVGSTQVVEIVNTSFAVFSKTGTVLYGPAMNNTLFSGFGGPCETTNDGDPIVRYDALANRWVITQFANVDTTGPFFECVAVSQTSDATGAWNRYSFQYPEFPDYPKLSVWPDAYYVTYNLFNAAGTTFLGAEDCAMDRAAMLAGTAATQQCFTTSTSFGSLLAADFEGGTAPPAGEDNTVVALGTTSTTLAYWKVHIDWITPANTTFTGPLTLTVDAYTTACGASGICIPQLGTSQHLDSLSDRLMFSLSYRNFGDHEAVVVNHAVTAGSSVGVRWYELRGLSGTLSVFQQGTYAPDTTYRWMGSIALDKVGNIGLGYSASSSSLNPSIRITGRLPGDPLGTMTQGDVTVKAGTGSQTNFSRWGDYSSMSVDPVDGCTFWYAQEYLATTGVFNWKTHLQSFTLPGCLAALPTLTTTASPDVALGGQVSDMATLANGVTPTGTITFTLFGPGDATCTGAPAFISAVAVSGNGNYTSGSFTPAVVGTYRWIAAYSGDVNNPPISTACNDPNETVVVTAVAVVTLTTRASHDVKLGRQVSDTATLAGGLSPTGTITFRLFGPGNATCTGTPAFTSTKPVSGNGSYTSAPFTPTVVGTYRWIAAYSGDANNSPVSTVCSDPAETVRVRGVLPVTGVDVRSLATLAVGLLAVGCLFIIVSGEASRRVRRRA